MQFTLFQRMGALPKMSNICGLSNVNFMNRSKLTNHSFDFQAFVKGGHTSRVLTSLVLNDFVLTTLYMCLNPDRASMSAILVDPLIFLNALISL